MSTQVNRCFVGIDVSKEKIDIHIRPHDISWTQGNSDLKTLVKKLAVYRPDLIVLEPTGGYELGVYNALVEAGFKVSREHAYKIHHHAKAMGELAKTDSIDASVISHYARCYGEEIRANNTTKEQLLLSDLVGRRNQLIKLQTAEKNRLEKKCYSVEIQKSIKRILRVLDREIMNIEEEIKELIDGNGELRQRQDIIKTVVGIGDGVSSVIIGKLPELGKINRKKIAALVGVAPYQRESGKYKGQQMTSGGRFEVRNALFMAALSAIRHDDRFKSYYEKLVNKGKKKKLAIVACMHKMLRILNAMLANGECYRSA